MPTNGVRIDRCDQPLMHCTDLGLVHYKLCNPQESGGMKEATRHNHSDDPFGPSDCADRRLRLREGEGKRLCCRKAIFLPQSRNTTSDAKWFRGDVHFPPS
jgi:hypothetical protein